MVPAEKLRQDAGYAAQPGEFEDLLVVLDQQLRLIIPTDPLSQRISEEKSMDAAAGQYESGVCYQLTHDYLVPTLRKWLHLKQHETRSGRAELLLREQAALWQDRQGGKQFLPSLWEWLSIRVFTDKKRWSDVERSMVRASSRLYLSRFFVASAVVVLLAITLFQILARQQQEIARQQEKNAREETETLVTIMLGAPGSAFPYTSQLVLPFDKFAQEELDKRLNEGVLTPAEELHARLYLAGTGDIDVDFIVQAVDSCDVFECPNIVQAIRPSGKEAVATIQREFDRAQRESRLRTATRLAIVALSFGDTSLAEELARLQTDPWPRTLLIRTLGEWNCELSDWAKALESVDEPHLRSALCLGIGSIPNHEAAREWGRVWKKWYVEHPDAATHSASRWAMQAWKIPVPDIAALGVSASEPQQRDWYHTRPGVVLVRIPAGEFSRIDPGVKGAQRQTVHLEREFWASDREISVEQYRQFLKDSASLVGWQSSTPSPEHQFAHGEPEWPMQNVSWFEAVAFCNWLSEQEGLDPAYTLSDREERPAGVYFRVEKNIEANGFRLPTEAEWEYFTRAGTRTPYSCGDHQSPLADYANYGAVSPTVCGTRMCNGWGLFDTHGNVMEWCQDKWGRYPETDQLTNPQGPPFSTTCCFRGGGWFNGRRFCRSEYRSSGPPISKRYTIGFRVVRNASDG